MLLHKSWNIPLVLQYVVLGIIGASLFCVYYWFASQISEPKQDKSEAPTKQNTAKEISKTALLIRYVPSYLPILIEPSSSAYVFQLNPDAVMDWLWEIPNRSPKATSWPENFVVGENNPPEEIYICELTNHTDKALLDVSLMFVAQFFELVKVNVTVLRKEDGTFAYSTPTRGQTGQTFVFGRRESAEAITHGTLIKSLERRVTIPAIPRNSTIKIHFVNRSQLIAGFNLPKEATAIGADSSERIRINLVRPQATVLDIGSMFWLAPAKHHWKRVTGSS
jgi:hypothetical protein